MQQFDIILIDENDNQVGVGEKMPVHEQGLLHRAFSVFLFNVKGEMLLQQRAIEKYHSGGLWTNTCCSHPMPGEEVLPAANRRLMEEMGIRAELTKLFDLRYKASFSNGLIENEFDHIFIGNFDGEAFPNREEVMSYKYSSLQEIENELKLNPDLYTAWFQLAFVKIKDWWSEQYKNI